MTSGGNSMVSPAEPSSLGPMWSGGNSRMPAGAFGRALALASGADVVGWELEDAVGADGGLLAAGADVLGWELEDAVGPDGRARPVAGAGVVGRADVVGRELEDAVGADRGLLAAGADVIGRELEDAAGPDRRALTCPVGLAGEGTREGREAHVAHLRRQLPGVAGLQGSTSPLGARLGLLLRRWPALAHGPTVTLRAGRRNRGSLAWRALREVAAEHEAHAHGPVGP